MFKCSDGKAACRLKLKKLRVGKKWSVYCRWMGGCTRHVRERRWWAMKREDQSVIARGEHYDKAIWSKGQEGLYLFAVDIRVV